MENTWKLTETLCWRQQSLCLGKVTFSISYLGTYLTDATSREFGDNVPSENIRGAVEGVFQLEQALAAVSITFQLKRNIFYTACMYFFKNSFQFLRRTVEMLPNFTILTRKQN